MPRCYTCGAAIVTIRDDILDGIQQFLRNGRWGTCGSCPRLTDGSIAPELCEDTDRYDHNLDWKALAEQIQIDLDRIPTTRCKRCGYNWGHETLARGSKT